MTFKTRSGNGQEFFRGGIAHGEDWEEHDTTDFTLEQLWQIQNEGRIFCDPATLVKLTKDDKLVMAKSGAKAADSPGD